MSQSIVTFADAIQSCKRFCSTRGLTTNNGAQDEDIIRQAIQDALRELVGRRTWTRYKRELRLNLVAAYSTGTVVYDHTGGTYERMLTLTTGTWPTWAVYGEVVISNVAYQVDDRKSSSIITLDPQVNPGADVSSTTYSLHRYHYTLPSDFVKMGEPTLETSWGAMHYVSPEDILLYHRLDPGTTGDPTCYSIIGEPSTLGNHAIYLYPAPSSAQTLSAIYVARPRQLVYAQTTPEEVKGYISTVTDSPSITGVDTAFEAGMVGSILRIGENNTKLPGSRDSSSPPADQRTITGYSSATSITVDTGVNQTLSNVRFTISDPVDLDPGLIPCFKRACEKHLGLAYGIEDKKQDRIERAYENAYVLAAEEDSRSYAMQSVGGIYPSASGYNVLDEDGNVIS